MIMFGFVRKKIENESGVFYLNDGVVSDFKPSVYNPFTEEIIEEPQTYHGHTTKTAIKHLIVPKGVRGFADDFFRDVTITERFELPDGLLYIGNGYHDNGSHGCVFSHCSIPAVNIPETVIEIGEFAWGGSQIGLLKIPASIHPQKQYLRQFKDTHIQTLCLPKEWAEYFYIEGTCVKQRFSPSSQHSEQFGWLGLDATIDTLVFGKAQLADEYNKRLSLACSNAQDEQWFKGALQILSNDAFTCYGQGRHLIQNKTCEWPVIYDLLFSLKCVDAHVKIRISYNDLINISAEYLQNSIMAQAIENGNIEMTATLMPDKSVRLYRCLAFDIGDSGHFGCWTINLMAYLDCSGNFIKPFFIEDTRI